MQIEHVAMPFYKNEKFQHARQYSEQQNFAYTMWSFYFFKNQGEAILWEAIKVANGTISRQFFIYRFYHHHILRVLSRELQIRPHEHIASGFPHWTYVNKLRSTA